MFFRPFEVVGAERLRGRPLLLLANHGNALVDPLALLAAGRSQPLRIVAKHTLWRVPVLRAFLDTVRAIPVHRAGEDPEARRRNAAFFETCVGVLAGGGALAMFPEGRSHDEPAPVPLRTGAARIALAAAARDVPVSVVPVGLNYADKGRFRSALTVLVGVPRRVDRGAGGPDDADAVRRLTADFSAWLDEVVVGMPSWEEHRLLQLLASVAAPGEDGAGGLERRLALARGYTRLRPTRAAELDELRARLERLEANCRAIDVPPARLAPAQDGSGLRRLHRVVIGLPFAAWGVVNHWPAYRATGWLAARLTREHDQVAMMKLLGALVVFPLAALLQTALVAALAGLLRGAIYAALLIPSALYALRWVEAGRGVREEARVALRSLQRREELARLRAERRALLEKVDALAAELNALGR